MNTESVKMGNVGPRKQMEASAKEGQEMRANECNLHKVCRSYRKKRRGASAVEFAVVAPVFLLLVFGMIEYGRMVMVQQVITNASREGARKAVLDGSTASDVQSVVDIYLENGSVPGATITLDPADPSQAAFGDPVTVTVAVDFSQVSWLPTPMYLGGKTLSATTVMRREAIQ
jgi:Flp pilus assembly protein TadG